MAFRIANASIEGRLGGSPKLGAAPPLESIQATPDSVPPEKVLPIPVTTDEANKARVTYQLAAKALGGEVEWLGRLRPANWEETVVEVIKHSKTQYDVLVRDVRGRTGNPDAEYELELQWWGLWDRAYRAWANPPSWLARAADKAKVFLEDFSNGAKEAWQGYAEWAIRNSGPVLRRYHDGLRRVASLNAELEAAKASGEYSEGDLYDQAQAIARAETALDTVRSTYRAVSGGGDIDKIAIQELGPVSLGAWQIPVGYAIVISSVAATVVYALAVVFAVRPLTGGLGRAVDAFTESFKSNPIGTTLAVGFIVGMIALPFALTKKTPVENLEPSPEAA